MESQRVSPPDKTARLSETMDSRAVSFLYSLMTKNTGHILSYNFSYSLQDVFQE